MTKTGKIKKWFEEEGYGFISRKGEVDLFCHSSKILGDQPKAGDTVSFEEEETAKGWRAKNVVVDES